MSIKRQAAAIVGCYTGGRGSGKSLSMVFQAALEMLRGKRVWSNVKVAFNFDSGNGVIRRYESELLEMDSLYTFDPDLQHGLVLIDEINLWADSRRSMGVANRLLNAIFTLIRKRSLSFYLTVQNFQWLDNRIRWQVDLLCQCRDLSFSYAGMERGAFIAQNLTDMSGIFTGRPYDPHSSYNRYCNRTLFGKPFWNIYDSSQEFDVLEAQQRVRLNFKDKVVTRDDLSSAYQDDIETQIGLMREDLKQQGIKRIPAGVLREYLESCGVKGDARIIGKYLKQNGFRYRPGRSDNFYEVLPA